MMQLYVHQVTNIISENLNITYCHEHHRVLYARVRE